MRFIVFLILFLNLTCLAQYGLKWEPLHSVEKQSPFIFDINSKVVSKNNEPDNSFLFSPNYVSNKFSLYGEIEWEFSKDQPILKHEKLIPTESISVPNFFFKDDSEGNIKYIDKAHGFFTNNVNCITEDEKGLVYFASDDGLGIYNGDVLKVYKNCKFNNLNSVLVVFKDSKNRIWISTPDGNYAVIVTENACTDTSACIFLTNVGIEDNFSSSFEIYPNPFNDNLTVESWDLENYSISILNVEGKVIKFESITNSQRVLLSTAELQRGIYFIKIEAGDNQMISKIIKQ